MDKFYKLKPGMLTLDDLSNIINQNLKLTLCDSAYLKIDQSRKTVENIIETKKTVYGINTGFGLLAKKRISDDLLIELQRKIVLSHACGVGQLMSDRVVSLILIMKINALAQGYSGVRREVIDYLIAFYNHQIYPCIPEKGSVGASGDLAPLAHLSLALIGEGECRYQNQIISSKEALNILNLPVLELQAKEGLALLNGLQASAALAIDAYLKARMLFDNALIAGALSTDAATGSDVPFDDRISALRIFKEQRYVAKIYRALLEGSEVRASHKDCERVQDPYAIRCQPQVMGAILRQLNFVGETLETEANAVTDNPLVFSDDGIILSGGNFHGEMIAMAADNLALAIAEIGAGSERRIALLVDERFSHLPAFLVADGGVNSGFMIAHVTAAACASDNKALAHPHCVDSLPTSANQEDHVSMATNAARRLYEMIDNSATVVAIELLAACQGLEFHHPLKTSKNLSIVYDRIRQQVAPWHEDRYFAPDILAVKSMITDFKLIDLPN